MVIIRGDNLHLLFYFHLILSSPSSSFKSCIFIILISGFLCVCPVIDHEFRHNTVKVAVDPRGDSRGSADYYDNVMAKFIFNNRIDALTTDINFFYDNKLSNCPLSLADPWDEFQIHVSVRILTIKIDQWARVNFCSYRKNYFLHLSNKAKAR